MQVLCKSVQANQAHQTTAEANCPICGQGFLLFWERQTRMERAEALREVRKVLVNHHNATATAQAHPDRGFLVPEWNGPIAFSGAALLGMAPAWAL